MRFAPALVLILALAGCATPSAAPRDPVFAAWFADAPEAFYDVARLDVAVRSLEPNGGVAGTRSVCLTDGGAVAGCLEVSLIPGETKVVVFLQRNLAPGTHVFRALNATHVARIAPTPDVGAWIAGPRADLRVAHEEDAWFVDVRSHEAPPPIVEVRWRGSGERVRVVGERMAIPAPGGALADRVDAFVQDADGRSFLADGGLAYTWRLGST